MNRTNMNRSAASVLLLWLVLATPSAWSFQLLSPVHRSNVVQQPQRSLAFVPSLQPIRRCSAPLFATADEKVTSKAPPTTSKKYDDKLKKLFSDHSKNGSMTKADLTKIKMIKDVLKDEDLQTDELDEIWGKYADETADLAAFSKIYKEIDDLFEDEAVDTINEEEDQINTKYDELEDVDDPQSKSDATGEPELLLMDNAEALQELQDIFKVISNDDGVVSKETLRAWDEIETLLVEGMLGDDEFEELWAATTRKKPTTNTLDFEGFMVFNSKLDELFDFETDELADDDNKEETTTAKDDAAAPPAAVMEPEASSQAEEKVEKTLFQSLAKGGLVGMPELSGWNELQEMLSDGDLSSEELEQFYAKSLAQSKDASGLDERAFEALQSAIDDLFEEDNGEEEESTTTTTTAEIPKAAEPEVAAPEPDSSPKEDLLQALEVVNDRETDDGKERLPCGLESTEREEKLVLNLATKLIQQDSNILFERNIETADVAGTWELLYTSSSAMKFNKGLSGIGGSFPNGKFGGLTQMLSGSSLLPDIEYKERIEVKPSSASFDVTVNGYWELRQSMSLFTGEKSIVVAIEPNRVTYGPTSTKADHWKSLGPTNQLDLVYLDDDLRIMRGSTSLDTILIFQRIK